MKLYPYYQAPYQLYIDEVYHFFQSNYIQQFIVDMYKNKPIDSLDTIALALTYEYNSYTLVLLIDYSDPELYSVQIDNQNSSISIKKDMDSIYKAICDIKNGTLPLIENGTSDTTHINFDIYNYLIV